jgi:hypothetical protein
VPDSRLPVSAFDPQHSDTPRYRIVRKGSLYNILGPDGRLFTKYKSASVVGPRWEELTHTPWPYESTAYERGLRLPAHKPTPKLSKCPVVIKPVTVLALPAPRIDLDEHIRLMQTLRHNPVLLFDAQIQQALRHEVEYHRPDANWAQHLLKLLARYEQRQQQTARAGSENVLEKHIAWQEQMAKV